MPRGSEQQLGPFFYPPPPETPRIQHLASYSTAKDVTGGAKGFRWLILGDRAPRTIAKPYGTAMHDGKLFVCDLDAELVVVFDFVAKTAATFGHRHPGKLRKPINIAVADDGMRYVADGRLHRIMVYDGENRYVTSIGDPERFSPSDVVVAGDHLFSTDVSNGQVVVFDRSTGEELRRFSRKGSAKGQLFMPTNLTMDPQENIYVTDTGNFRVLKFNKSGKLLKQIGKLGRGLGQFARPKGLALDREERLYVVDAAFENVQVFDPDGHLLLAFGAPGNAPDSINLPAQIEIDYDHVELFQHHVEPGYSLEYLIFVTSQFGRNKVNLYGFLSPRDVAHPVSP